MLSFYYRLSDRGLVRPIALLGCSFSLACVLAALSGDDSCRTGSEVVVDAAPAELPLFVTEENEIERACQLAIGTTHGDAGLGDVALTLHRVGRAGTLAQWKASTSARGAHTFIDVPPGTYHLNAAKAGYATTATETWTCEGDETRGQAFIDLVPATSSVRVVVTGDTEGALTGAEIMLEAERNQPVPFFGVVHLVKGDDGAFAADLPPGRYVVLAVADNHVGDRQTVTVPEAGRASVNFALTFRPEASGRVVDDQGVAVPFAEVFLGPLSNPSVPATSVTADADGQFRIPVVPGLKHTLAAHKRALFGAERIAPTYKGQGPSDIEIVMPRGHRISGFLQNERGVPLGLELVQFRVRDFGIVGKARTDANGRFAVPGLPFADVEVWPAEGATGAWAGQVATVKSPSVLLTSVTPAY